MRWILVFLLFAALRTGQAAFPQLADDATSPQLAARLDPEIVILYTAHKPLDEERLKATIAREFGTDFSDSSDASVNFVVPSPPGFVCQFDGHIAMVASIDGPYVNEREGVISSLSDPNAVEAIRRQNAFVGVSMITTFTPTIEDHHALGRLALALMDKTTVGFVEKQLAAVSAVDDSTTGTLTDGLPFRLFAGKAQDTSALHAETGAMKAAVEEAQATLDKFRAQFEHKQDDDMFFLKANFCEGERCEVLWVELTRLEDRIYKGVVESDPEQLKTIARGQTVDLTSDQIHDWLMVRGEELFGGYTIKAAAKQ